MNGANATAPVLPAETSLRELLDLCRREGTTLPQITRAIEQALLEIGDDCRQCDLHIGGRRRPCLATVTSFAFPRVFAPQAAAAVQAPAFAQMSEEDLLRQAAAEGQTHNHICFTVEVTHGPKTVVGREVEVQVQDAEAERLAAQILRLIAWRRNTSREGTTARPARKHG
ncbi:hypothetical protein ACFVV7_35660 [Streptomyces globisporus]|uniref:hypothetical protein n=1 Tax=Streptomyces globisporus TaxID=1908 RepID=UPI0036D9B183